MTLSTIDWTIVAVYFVLSLSVGLMFTRRAGRSTENYFLAGRTVPWWLAGISIVATTFASDTPLLVAGITARGGIAGARGPRVSPAARRIMCGLMNSPESGCVGGAFAVLRVIQQRLSEVWRAVARRVDVAVPRGQHDDVTIFEVLWQHGETTSMLPAIATITELQKQFRIRLRYLGTEIVLDPRERPENMALEIWARIANQLA